MTIQEKLKKLRELMREKNISAYLINGSDPHMSEYIPARWATRAFISGFTGSAGTVVITTNKACLWTDSRYFLQAEDELKGTEFILMKIRTEGHPTIEEWIESELDPGDALGVDGDTLSIASMKVLRKKLKSKFIYINNELDLLSPIWSDRPAFPDSIAEELTEDNAGQSRQEKIHNIQSELKRAGADLQIISALDDLCWTFNLRGTDVEFNPYIMAHGIITTNEACLFCYPEKLPVKLQNKLKEEGIRLYSYDELKTQLKTLTTEKIIYIDPARTSTNVYKSIPVLCVKKKGISIPCTLKSHKTQGELKNIKKAMQKDGIAMVKFLYWVEHTIGKEPLTEYSLVEKLDEFRKEQSGYRGFSFYPITGYAQHGAIVHIKVTPQNALPLQPEGLVVIDSGGQYTEGTTDLTRTLVLGPLSDEMKRDYTLVLKGMIALSQAHFPTQTRGYHLDILARQYLWQAGLNYGHGTGHGIGYFLAVHEGPMSIRPEFNDVCIEDGMVISNEPGVYHEGKYGIRIENVIHCITDKETEFGKFLRFETLSLCPIDVRGIDRTLLNTEEKQWINQYHQLVYTSLAPAMDEAHRHFLANMTKEI